MCTMSIVALNVLCLFLKEMLHLVHSGNLFFFKFEIICSNLFLNTKSVGFKMVPVNSCRVFQMY